VFDTLAFTLFDAVDESEVGALEQAAKADKLITMAARFMQILKTAFCWQVEVKRSMASSYQRIPNNQMCLA
jgi:hypothetical protein